jgi:mannose/fructose/N-acetylgalactosamine-specific phosphotransferase system component IID
MFFEKVMQRLWTSITSSICQSMDGIGYSCRIFPNKKLFADNDELSKASVKHLCNISLEKG